MDKNKISIKYPLKTFIKPLSLPDFSIPGIRVVQPAEIKPQVKMANYMKVNKNASWGPRKIVDLELILVLKGGFEFITDKGEKIFHSPYEILTIFPGERHLYRRINNTGESLFSCIHCELLPSLLWQIGDYRLNPAPWRLTKIEKTSEIPSLFHRAAQIFEGYSKYKNALLESVVKEIWLLLCEKWNQFENPDISKRILEMIQYLRKNMNKPVSRQDLAKEFYITPEHVNYLFQKEIGLTPTQLLNRERILCAYNLMHHEGQSVKQASLRVGFSDPFYFSKMFKRQMGFSPSQA
jgi:AraC-like DNA-binding protein